MPPSGGQQPEGPLGLQPNIAGMLAYAPCCIGLVMSIVLLATEKTNRFIKFHAWQGLLVHLLLSVIVAFNSIISFILSNVSTALSVLTTLFGLVIFLAGLGLSAFLMVKAYNNATPKLPLIGDFAAKQS